MKSKFLINIESVVLKNLDNEELSIEFICKEVGISRSQLHRKVKEETGVSSTIYIRRIKLEQGRKLLLDSDLNVSEIAYAVGINSPQNFSRYFVQEFGLSPTAYRKVEISKPQEIVLPEMVAIPEISSYGVKKEKENKYVMILSLIGILSFVSIVLALTQPLIQKNSPELDFKTLKYNKGIAVLPFKYLGPVDTTFLAEGLTEDIISQLSKIEDLPVISRTSSYKFKDSELSVSAIGDELKVPYILEGSIRVVEGKIKVSTNLVDTNDDTSLWTKSIEKNRQDIMEIQSEIALEIASSLHSNMQPDVIFRVKEAPTQNVSAYNQVLIGKHLLRSREKDDLEQSLKRFDEAIKMDSTYADAYVYKAYALHLLGNLKYRDPMQSYNEAEAYALKALSFNQSNGQAYGILGNIYANQYKWGQAETSFNIALESQPGDAMLNYWYSLVKRTRGQIDEALYYNDKAKLLDPLYPVIHAGYIATCIYGKKYEKAWNEIQEDSLLFHDNFVFHWVKAEYYSAREEYEKAVEHFEEGLKMNPNINSMKTGKAYALAKIGDHSEAINLIQIQSEDIPAQIHTKAVLFAGIGNFSESLKYFIQAAEKGFIASDVLVDPTYAPFVENREYRTYLRKYNFIE